MGACYIKLQAASLKQKQKGTKGKGFPENVKLFPT